MKHEMIWARAAAFVRHALFPAGALATLSVAIILGAWGFQLVGGLVPCPLCLEQRVPWYLLIGVGCACVVAQQMKAGRAVMARFFAIAIALALWSSWQGLYHAGIEYTWWPGPPTCTTSGGAVDVSGGLSDLEHTKIVMCDVAQWTLLGVSLAGFNFLFSLLGAAIAGLGLRGALKEMT